MKFVNEASKGCNMRKTYYTKKKYWDGFWRKANQYKVIDINNETVKLVEQWIPNAENGQECFEIGCCPCSYLAYMGIKKKYVINGLDYSDGINGKLFEWLSKLPIKLGKIEKKDFLKSIPKQKYHFVYSLGFIEHFGDYQKVLRMHIPYVEKGGYLLITTPNFEGAIQHFLHKVFDNENLKRHNLNSMHPEVWKKLIKEEEFDILFCGYYGGFHFWVEEQKRSAIMKVLLSSIFNISTLLERKGIKSRKIYSPYCALIARKR